MNIVVTGSSTGIGRALAHRLLRSGHSIWGIARSEQSAAGLSATGAFNSSRCDVADFEQLSAVAAKVAASWPSVDCLVCCVGSQGEVGPAVRADPSKWSATVRSNLDGTFNPIRAFHPLIARAQRRGKIVCFSGGGATKARPNFSAYGVSKTAIVRLVETIAEEEKDAPLDINAIAPGAIATRLTEEVIALGPGIVGQAEYDAAVKQMAGGGASLERALDLVEWLLSENSDGVTGKLISAPWDPWQAIAGHATSLARSDVYTLRRIVPEDRGMNLK